MTTRHVFNLDAADSSWQPCLREALQKMDPDYLEKLYHSPDWLPGTKNIFNAFSLPVSKTSYILFGESPYPRAASANGYAFWDAAVHHIWSETGLSKQVNRATSLRNIIKTLLIAEGLLPPSNTTQPDIAKLDKQKLIKTNDQLFQHLLSYGFLLLNATPVLQPGNVRQDAKAWQPFIRHVLDFILHEQPKVKLILLGNIANMIDKLVPAPGIHKIYAEHPYNISFIHNSEMIQFFKPLHLLRENLP